MSCDIWMGVVVLLAPISDRSLCEITNLLLKDVLLWVNYDSFVPDLRSQFSFELKQSLLQGCLNKYTACQPCL